MDACGYAIGTTPSQENNRGDLRLLTRWLAYIGMFYLEITHVHGVTNTAADAISRLPAMPSR